MLGYVLGGYVPPRYPNVDPVLEIGQFLIPRSRNLVNFNSPLLIRSPKVTTPFGTSPPGLDTDKTISHSIITVVTQKR